MIVLMWAAAAFAIVKIVFKYLSWVFRNEDKPLREAIEAAWVRLEDQSFFEVVTAAISRLNEKAIDKLRGWKGTVVAVLAFGVLNVAAIGASIYVIGIDQHLLSAMIHEIGDALEASRLAQVGVATESPNIGVLLLAAIQFTALDVVSLLVTVMILGLASRAKNWKQLVFELSIDISIVGTVLLACFALLYLWHREPFDRVIIESCSVTFDAVSMIIFPYILLVYVSPTVTTKVSSQLQPLPRSHSPEGLLWRLRADPMKRLVVVLGPLFLLLMVPGLVPAWQGLREIGEGEAYSLGELTGLRNLLGVPLSLLCAWRILLWRPKGAGRVLTVALRWPFILYLNFLVVTAIIDFVFDIDRYAECAHVLAHADVLALVGLLAITSVLPTLAHLVVVGAAVMAKLTPKWVQLFVRRNILALAEDESRILGQVGNAFGGLAALIVAVLKLLA